MEKNGPKVKNIAVLGNPVPQIIVNVYHTHAYTKQIYICKQGFFLCFVF